MNYHYITRMVCLLGISIISAETIKDEFERFSQSDRYNHFFSLTEQEKKDFVISENIKKFNALKEEVRRRTPQTSLEESLLVLIDSIIASISVRVIEDKAPVERALQSFDKMIAHMPSANPSQSKGLLNLFLKLKRTYKNAVELTAFYDALYLPKNNFPSLYSFVSDICRANHLATPRLYVLKNDNFYASVYQHSSPPLSGVISISDSIFTRSNDEIKGVIAHEIGHLYYRDLDRCYKFSNEETKKKINHLSEYRADLFAAQYGFGAALAKLLAASTPRDRMRIIDFSNMESTTHPAPRWRIEPVRTLPTAPAFFEKEKNTWRFWPFSRNKEILRTEYRPSFTEGKLKLEPVTKPATPLAPKIVSSSAQPIRLNPRTAQALLQVARKVPK